MSDTIDSLLRKTSKSMRDQLIDEVVIEPLKEYFGSTTTLEHTMYVDKGAEIDLVELQHANGNEMATYSIASVAVPKDYDIQCDDYLENFTYEVLVGHLSLKVLCAMDGARVNISGDWKVISFRPEYYQFISSNFCRIVNKTQADVRIMFNIYPITGDYVKKYNQFCDGKLPKKYVIVPKHMMAAGENGKVVIRAHGMIPGIIVAQADPEYPP